MFEDRILISRFKAGSMEAFRRIFDKYEGDLMTLAANLLTDANAAEDVLQDVFMSFLGLDAFEIQLMNRSIRFLHDTRTDFLMIEELRC